MRLVLKLAIFSFGFAAVSPVLAADTWTGVYLGGTIGRRMIDAEWQTTCLAEGFPGAVCPDASGIYPERFVTDNPADLSDRALRLGVYAGAQLQLQNFVIGIEGDWAHAKSKMSHGGIPGAEDPTTAGPTNADDVTVTAEWDASVRGRLGFLITPATMLFGTGGVSWMKLEASAFCGIEFPEGWCSAGNVGLRDTISEAVRGHTIGGGFETMLTPNLLFRAEYRHSEYGSIRHRFFDGRLDNADAVTARVATETDTVSLGLAFKY